MLSSAWMLLERSVAVMLKATQVAILKIIVYFPKSVSSIQRRFYDCRRDAAPLSHFSNQQHL